MAMSVNIRRTLKRWARRLPFPHWLRFYYHYVLRLGILDGVPGYILSHLLAEYEFLVWAKTWQHNHTLPEPVDTTSRISAGTE